ncbi:MAG TPA: ferredoxin reductase [Trebonia sp.]|nr:ferredoxin reductase [Trebonia sp.]
MARAAVPGRLNWLVATLAESRDETATARTLVFDVPGWPGHLAGQHVDVKLTAEDGYSVQRSYSIASAPDGARLELTVQTIADGEVSPYLTEVLEPGDPLELRGPIGYWFVWRPESPAPVLLVAGGSGVVPLMAMIRARAAAGSKVPLRLIYSVRTPADAIYAPELSERAVASTLDVTYLYTRTAPPGGRTGRISADVVAAAAWTPADKPEIFICGPTGFVEAAAALLVDAGHDPSVIKTERFGPTS